MDTVTGVLSQASGDGTAVLILEIPPRFLSSGAHTWLRMPGAQMSDAARSALMQYIADATITIGSRLTYDTSVPHRTNLAQFAKPLRRRDLLREGLRMLSQAARRPKRRQT